MLPMNMPSILRSRRSVLEVGERRHAAAEIVERERTPMRRSPRSAHWPAEIADRDVLGGLEADAPRIHAARRKALPDELARFGINPLSRERLMKIRATRLKTSACVRAHSIAVAITSVVADRQVASFHGRQKGAGRHGAAGLVAHAQQQFVMGQAWRDAGRLTERTDLLRSRNSRFSTSARFARATSHFTGRRSSSSVSSWYTATR